MHKDLYNFDQLEIFRSSDHYHGHKVKTLKKYHKFYISNKKISLKSYSIFVQIKGKFIHVTVCEGP
jgi:hypothetical protein